MDKFFPPYAIFSALAILVKIAMLVRYRSRLSLYSRSFKLLFACFFWLNIVELLSFYYPRADRISYALLVSYYASLITGIGALTAISLSTSGLMNRWREIMILSWVAGLLALTFVPGYLLSGVRHIGFTFTRSPGDYYWVFQVTLLAATLVNALALFRGSLSDDDRWRRLKSKALLVSLAPIFLVVPVVLLLMHIGVPVTGTVFGSFAILFFLVTLMATEAEIMKKCPSIEGHQNILRFLSLVPATTEFQLANRVRRAVATEYSNDLEKAVSSYEKTLVHETLAMCNGNKSSAAKLLGISRTTLRRKLKSYAEG